MTSTILAQGRSSGSYPKYLSESCTQKPYLGEEYNSVEKGGGITLPAPKVAIELVSPRSEKLSMNKHEAYYGSRNSNKTPFFLACLNALKLP